MKKFFNEEKLPLIDREYLPVIAQEGGKEVYVVCGVEISERLKITETTKEILYISVKNGLHE